MQGQEHMHVLPTEHPRREVFLVFVEGVSDNRETLPDIIAFVTSTVCHWPRIHPEAPPITVLTTVGGF